jgi:sec-independent protein translocase protein TatB
MLDIGWPEFCLIAVVTIIVVGPKELPRVVRTVSGVIRKVRGLAGEFQSTLDDMAREADLEDIKKEIERVSRIDVADEFKAGFDPSGTLDGAFDIGGSAADDRSILASAQAAAAGTGTSVADDPGEDTAAQTGDPVPESAACEAAQADEPPVASDDGGALVEDATKQRSPS